MPRMQVYLPDDLYAIVKSQGLSASRLLQDAVRDQCLRQEKIRAAQEYVQEIYDELGPPTAEEIAWADAKAREIVASLRAGEQSDTAPLADASQVSGIDASHDPACLGFRRTQPPC